MSFMVLSLEREPNTVKTELWPLGLGHQQTLGKTRSDCFRKKNQVGGSLKTAGGKAGEVGGMEDWLLGSLNPWLGQLTCWPWISQFIDYENQVYPSQRMCLRQVYPQAKDGVTPEGDHSLLSSLSRQDREMRVQIPSPPLTYDIGCHPSLSLHFSS